MGVRRMGEKRWREKQIGQRKEYERGKDREKEQRERKRWERESEIRARERERERERVVLPMTTLTHVTCTL